MQLNSWDHWLSQNVEVYQPLVQVANLEQHPAVVSQAIDRLRRSVKRRNAMATILTVEEFVLMLSITVEAEIWARKKR